MPGTYGNGYDGVRRGKLPAGVAGTLARTVLFDSVDSVDTVELVRTPIPGFAIAALRDGDPDVASSSCIGETRVEGLSGFWL